MAGRSLPAAPCWHACCTQARCTQGWEHTWSTLIKWVCLVHQHPGALVTKRGAFPCLKKNEALENCTQIALTGGWLVQAGQAAVWCIRRVRCIFVSSAAWGSSGAGAQAARAAGHAAGAAGQPGRRRRPPPVLLRAAAGTGAGAGAAHGNGLSMGRIRRRGPPNDPAPAAEPKEPPNDV
jgi:hypothetical protein